MPSLTLSLSLLRTHVKFSCMAREVILPLSLCCVESLPPLSCACDGEIFFHYRISSFSLFFCLFSFCLSLTCFSPSSLSHARRRLPSNSYFSHLYSIPLSHLCPISHLSLSFSPSLPLSPLSLSFSYVRFERSFSCAHQKNFLAAIFSLSSLLQCMVERIFLSTTTSSLSHFFPLLSLTWGFLCSPLSRLSHILSISLFLSRVEESFYLADIMQS